jgi:protein gp37
MAERTKIEWCDDTRNAVNGCSVLSPGCTNCYAMRLAGTRLRNHPSRAGLTRDSKAGPVWTGEVRLNARELLAPLRQKRGRRIFWNAHGDLFHEAVPDEWIDRLFAVCALTPQHTHMILTKRSARMREYFNRPAVAVRVGLEACVMATEAMQRNPRSTIGLGIKVELSDVKPGRLLNWPLPNVWLGVSVEDQARADERIPDLLATPAAVRFISAEPLLGPVDLRNWLRSSPSSAYLSGKVTADMPAWTRIGSTALDWVIVGGESGPGARPMQNEWAQSLVDQCKAAGVAAFVKQLSNGTRALHDIDQFPEGLRVRAFPGRVDAGEGV